jgi:hypothetical protein
MVYKDEFVAVVTCNGKILRSIDGIDRLPFGSEYEILLKNLSSRDALVRISIDGQDVCTNGIIVKAGQSFPIERFVTDGNMDQGNKFKFIQKTQKIVNHRGDKIDDGIIRVEYWYAKPKTIQIKSLETHHYHYHWKHHYYPEITWYSSNTGANLIYSNTSNDTYNVNCCTTQSISRSIQEPEQIIKDAVNIQPDEGITVPGSISQQKFLYGTIGEVEPQSHVIILRLAGMTANGQLYEVPITTKTLLKCSTCGTENKSNMKFCGECGTSLQIV